MPDIDFAAVKNAVSIEAGARFLGLKLVQHQETFRCPCPVCKRAGDRAIVITPREGKWYCHGTCKTGGDVIKLLAHIRGTNQTQAAKTLVEQFMQEPPKRKTRAKRTSAAFNVVGDEAEQWEAFIARL